LKRRGGYSEVGEAGPSGTVIPNARPEALIDALIKALGDSI
jgi:hypothetical protein